MLTALNLNLNKKVIAIEQEKDGSEFQCPECSGIVILKKGNIKIHHFAHEKNNSIFCEYGEGESEIHHQIKLDIYNILKKSYHGVEIEHTLECGTRPDVFLSCKKLYNGIAFEIQKSNITIPTIIKRMERNSSFNVPTLWILPDIYDIKTSEKFAPKDWMKFLHAMYYEHLFFYNNGNIIDVKLEKYTLYKDSAEWYTKGGEYHSVDGYSYYSKRYRTIKIVDECDVKTFFKKLKFKLRNAYHMEIGIIPRCLLLTTL